MEIPRERVEQVKNNIAELLNRGLSDEEISAHFQAEPDPTTTEELVAVVRDLISSVSY